MVEQLVKIKRGLQQMVINPWYDKYMRQSRKDKDHKHTQKAQEVKRLINDNRLWISCNDFMHLLWPIHWLESGVCNTGLNWEFMITLLVPYILFGAARGEYAVIFCLQ